MVFYGKISSCMLYSMNVIYMVWHVIVQWCTVWCGVAWHCLAMHGRLSIVWYGIVFNGMARLYF